MKITLLGTGSSTGIPVLGCKCRVCTSKKKKNRRYRPAALITINGKNILIDAPPELRLQLLENKVHRIDAVLFTHCHADHVYGLDDLRVFCREKKMPVYAGKNTLSEMKKIFPYVFKRTQKGGGKPRLRIITVDKPFTLFGQPVIPVPVMHGRKRIFGYRLGAFAYIPDLSRMPARSYSLIEGLKVLVIDALRDVPHVTHVSLAESVEIARRSDAKKAYFTHISHRLEHYDTCAKLPKWMSVAYDGQTFKL